MEEILFILIVINLVIWGGNTWMSYVFDIRDNQNISFRPGKYLKIGNKVIGKPVNPIDCIETVKIENGFIIKNKSINLNEIGLQR